jgi:hypothetical protein
VWSIADLLTKAANEAAIAGWRDLVEVARTRFEWLVIPDELFLNKMLARGPFSDVIARQTLDWLGKLNRYMADRGPNGDEGPIARSIYGDFFCWWKCAIH